MYRQLNWFKQGKEKHAENLIFSGNSACSNLRFIPAAVLQAACCSLLGEHLSILCYTALGKAFDAFIYIFFALEMVIKMVALGIFGRRCYLGDTWNRLDFFIVMAGMVEYSLDLQNVNFTAIRTHRGQLAARTVARSLSELLNMSQSLSPKYLNCMRILVNLLLDTLPMLGNVLLLCFFVFFIFGIIGVQLWAGLLRNRCYPEENFTLTTGISLPRPYYMADEDDERPFICSLPVDNGIMSCTDVPARREGGRTCCLDKDDALYRQSLGLSPEPLANGSVSVAGLCVNWNQYYTRCHTGYSNPHKGAINFDNIAYAWIVIFQVITLEGWVEIMYYVMDAHSFYNFIYFILLIIVGSFFMINLCLVVIATQFSETKQREHQLMQEQRARCSSSSTLASEPGDCYEELFQLVCHILRKARRQTVALFNTLRGKPRGFRGVGRGGGGREGRERKANGRRRRERRAVLRHGPPCPHHSKPDHASSAEPMALTSTSATVGCPQCAAALSLADGVGPVRGAANDEAEEGAVEETDTEGVQSGGKDKKDRDDAGTGCSPQQRCKKLWYEIRTKLWGIVESKYFNRGIMIAILINTISMGIEHHEQPEELTNVLEICNIVFTSMFSLEMILKITAFGSFSYLRNPYNVFDGVIVIISVCEIVGQSDGGLSVLRTFRLLRVLKLVRFMPALRRQLVVLMKTMDNVATFCMLLMLFIFIFSILGMHIFGCKFSLKTETGDTVPDRKNFDSLLWAIVTVFQILTQEDWNVVLYNGMAATSPLAALYFVALMTFGNYVLFNLLVAILVEGFQAEGDANRSYSDDDHSSSNFDESEKHDSIKLSDPRICTLTPNGHLELGALSGPRGSYSSERRSFTMESRKSSVMSLGKSSLERRSLSLSLCFRIQKMMEVYKPDWCETREEWSVYMFSPQNKFRVLCQSIIAHKLFDYVVLAFIFLNCITVALERPKIMQGSLERLFLTISNYIFTAIFVAEMTVKGDQQGSRAEAGSRDPHHVSQAHRQHRPHLLCLLHHLRHPWCSGKFYYCVGFDVKNITNKSDCLAASYRWVHHKYNFDNLGQALMSLFVLASKDGWVNIMYHGLDAVGIDQQPVTNNNPWMLLYFISFLLIVSFFVLNMFVGVVVENFHKCRQHQEVEEARRREEKRQRRMEKKRRKAQKMPYYASYGPARLAIHTLCTSHYLDLVITFIICINVITMSLEHYSQPQSLETTLKYCNYFFTSTFVIEASLKLVAFGFRRFFKDSVEVVENGYGDESSAGYSGPGSASVCNADYPCEGMSRHATFENFGMAFLTLFQVSTGDNWNGIMKDTLRECPPGRPGSDYGCHPGLQFISPMYFVSFVLTAQFVLINVVVAVLMKHLDDSNKEAQEDAEMDAEIELELAQGGLCCMMGGIGAIAGATGAAASGAGASGGASGAITAGTVGGPSGTVIAPLRDGGGGGGAHEGHTHHRCRLYSPALRGSSDSRSSEELPTHGCYRGLRPSSSGSEEGVRELFEVGVHPQLCPPSLEQQSLARCTDGDGGSCSGGGGRGSSPVFHLPADFFHPAAAAHGPGSPGNSVSPGDRGPSRLASPASWASLRSPGANSRPLTSQHPSHSDSSLATGSSEGSLQTTLEEGLSFSVSPPRDLDLAMPLLCPLPNHPQGPATGDKNQPLLKKRSTTFTLQATRGHQRSQNSCGGGSTSPGCPRQDSMDPSDEDVGTGTGGDGCRQTFNSEHLSETLNSLSLTSLFTPSSLAPPLMKKCNSTGSLDQTKISARGKDGRQFYGIDAHGYLSNPWTAGREPGEDEDSDITGFRMKNSSRPTDTSSRKNR
ncbi:hypothetical protein PAMP_021446 [Pampus punctatissimus]